jgi:hypothetical protein
MEPTMAEQDLTFEVRPAKNISKKKSGRVTGHRTLNYVKFVWLQQVECEAT